MITFQGVPKKIIIFDEGLLGEFYQIPGATHRFNFPVGYDWCPILKERIVLFHRET